MEVKERMVKGARHFDPRGTLSFNNDFDASQIKRIYTIENSSLDLVRGWQGHKIEQRWFAAMSGSFQISVVKIDDWDNPSHELQVNSYTLNTDRLDFLHVPAGMVTAIRAFEENSKLLVLADFQLGEIQDEYRFSLDFFS